MRQVRLSRCLNRQLGHFCLLPDVPFSRAEAMLAMPSDRPPMAAWRAASDFLF